MHISCAWFPSSSHVLFRFSRWWLLPTLASSFHFGSTAILNLVLHESSCHLTDSSFHSLKPRHQTFFLPIIFIPKSDSTWHLPWFDFFNLSQPGSEVHVCLQLWQFGSYIGSETLNLFRTVRQGAGLFKARWQEGVWQRCPESENDNDTAKSITKRMKDIRYYMNIVLHYYDVLYIYVYVYIRTQTYVYIYTYVYYI